MSKGRVVVRVVAVLVALGVLLTAAVIYGSEDVRWRVTVLGKKATGQLDDIGWVELLQMLAPGSGFWLKPIADGYSLHGTITNPYGSPDDLAAGGRIFASSCSGCHESHGGTGAPNLAEAAFKHGASDWALFNVIRRGVPGTAMTGVEMPDRDTWQVVAYVRSLRQQTAAAGAEGPAVEIEPVTYEAIRAGTETGQWLTYSGSYDGHRFSPLAEIDRSNVGELRIDWVLQLQTEEPHSESTPIIVGDVMFLTVSPNQDLAVDTTSGRVLWSARRPLADKLTNCCGPHNRGVAILGERIFRGTLDGYLIARDARTGALLWETEVGSAATGHSITAAPLAVEDLVITGIAGGEYGIRGYLDAYDAATGERRWRVYTIPAPGEPGNETWEGDSWRTGGGPTWMTGSYDPELRLVYWGVGNPAPDFNGEDREGDNLYTNSVIAVDVDSGELRWHFQFTPHDLHDWDSNQVPVLVDTAIDGVPRKLLLTANKNGFGYVLDRVTGEFLTAHEVVQQTWAESIGPDGRPVKRPGIEPSEVGTLVRPGTTGGANWWPPSYNPLTNLVHYSLLESENVFFKTEAAYEGGEQFVGSAGRRLAGERHLPVMRAYRAGTGELAWEFAMPARHDWPQVGGSLTTGGMLVFFGERDYFFALDAETGEPLWRKNLGASIHAAPVTYLSGGRQRIAVAAGRSLYQFSLE